MTGGAERLAVGEVCLGNLVRKQCLAILMAFEQHQFQGNNLFLLHCVLASLMCWHPSSGGPPGAF